jgi:hypothetical protein
MPRDGDRLDGNGDSPFEGGGNRFGSLGDVAVVSRAALSPRHPHSLEAAALLEGEFSRERQRLRVERYL